LKLTFIGAKIESIRESEENEFPSIRSRGFSPTPRRAKKVDVAKTLGELKAERDQIEDAIAKLELLAQGRSRRRGRPPAWRTMAAAAPAAKRRGRPPGSRNKVRTSEGGAPPDSTANGASGV
jgi:hypothetical protein